ncbi:OmpA family protein [Carboxylicivirga linearis]|uniref:OmpA family protein n=2 Tax=Carboxylicivirga linearis TaxID=1628157 RepID=A0ABS5JWW9_9BACT|nr:OmpA family protein [Carboxylicivirga linearis]
MLYRITMLLVAIFWYVISFGQVKLELKKYHNWQLKKMYNEAIWLDDYITAQDIAIEMIERKPNKLNYHVYFLNALVKAKKTDEAYEFAKNEFEENPYEHGKIAFYLAELEKNNGNYETAIEILSRLRTKTRRIEMGNITRERIENSIAGCNLAIKNRDTIVYTKVKRLEGNVNTSNLEFNPVLLESDELIFGNFKENTDLKEDLNRSFRSKRGFSYAKKKKDLWTIENNVPEPYFNYSDYDTGDGTYSIDKRRFYFSKSSRDNNNKYISNIYISTLESGIWSTPVKLNKSINKKGYTSSQPTVGTCYDPSLEVIYFVSDRRGGAGGKDIWYFVYDKTKNEHSKAYNVGAYINTSGDEITPYFDLESHALFFSSNGHASFGGYDIFYSKGELVNWLAVMNVGYPINSSFDDIDYFRNESGMLGVFASNRKGISLSMYNQSLNDIFLFEETTIARIFVKGQIKTQDLLMGHGFVDLTEKNQKSGVLANQSIAISQQSDTAASLLIKETFTNENGEFGVWLDKGHEYRVEVKDTLVVGGSFSFTTLNKEKVSEISLDLKPVLTIPDKPVEIENIYYEFGKAELTKETKQVLDSTLVRFVSKHPDIIIRIVSHTDNVGSERYNQRLSEKRALNVVRYLISKGISTDRLISQGKGESEPIAPNENPDGSDNSEGRMKNRRTEIEIIGIR